MSGGVWEARGVSLWEETWGQAESKGGSDEKMGDEVTSLFSLHTRRWEQGKL